MPPDPFAAMRLDGRAALVTGAGKGLGRAIAQGLAAAGAGVLLVARTRSDLASLQAEIEAAGGRAAITTADVTDTAAVKAAVEACISCFGRLDILVNSAGGSLRRAALDITDDQWEGVINANLSSTFKACREAGRVMVGQGRGSIINIASAAELRGRSGNSPYSAAKAAVLNLTRALAMEWAHHGVRVNALAPGRFLTPLTADEMAAPEKLANFLRNVPLGRIGHPAELREIVVWLASDASAYVTGSTITLDGGQTLL